MVGERTPARASIRKEPKPFLSDSWVVESDSDNDYTPTQSKPPSRKFDIGKQPTKASRSNDPKPSYGRSAEPEFIMPLIHERDLDNSFESHEASMHSRVRRRQRSPVKQLAPKMRSSRESSMQETLEDAMMAILDMVRPILLWIYDVLAGALFTLKVPISYLLAVWLLVGMMVFLRNLMFSSVYSALSPVCRIPGARFLDLPMCQSSVNARYTGEETPPIQFDQLMTVQNKFEDVLQESAGGVSLPLDMKRGETSIRDLRQVVRFSQLHSRNELVLEFDGFIETARIASFDLQKFNSHVGRGVDNILATARWTKRVLDGIAERDASQGFIKSFLNEQLLAPFQPVKFTEDVLLNQYIQHTRIVEDEINRLVIEAQALLLVLQNLEDRLDVIHGIALRDNLHAQGSKAEVLSQLWTMLGGNRSKLGKYDSQLRLLNQVDTYRQSAIAHVSGTMVKLQGMGTELEELRERVGGVELLQGTAAVPLSVHIENIEMGVERLEKGRKGARELENEELKKNLGKARGEERMLDGPV